MASQTLLSTLAHCTVHHTRTQWSYIMKPSIFLTLKARIQKELTVLWIVLIITPASFVGAIFRIQTKFALPLCPVFPCWTRGSDLTRCEEDETKPRGRGIANEVFWSCLENLFPSSSELQKQTLFNPINRVLLVKDHQTEKPLMLFFTGYEWKKSLSTAFPCLRFVSVLMHHCTMI